MTGLPRGSEGVGMTSSSTTQGVSVESLSAARDLATRVRNRKAQVRRSMLVRTTQFDGVTALQVLLRGREDRAVGRGGDVRLKLLLSLLWVAGNPPYDVSYPARAWATLLDLRDPDKAGARRVSQAFQWLEAWLFVTVENQAGRPLRVTLLREDGSGSAYVPPGAVNNRLTQALQTASDPDQDALRARREEERYLQLPATLWTQGWIQTLSSAGLSMLLVLLSESLGGAQKELWLTPDLAARRYGLSPATRSTGLRELVNLRVARVKRRTVSRDVFDYRRMRNVYRLDMDALADRPSLAATKKVDPFEL